MGEIFSPGKLLLTSEYAVLDGALALAVATKPGQEFFFEEEADGKSTICWTAKHLGKVWLSAEIDYSQWEIIETNDTPSAKFVLKILKNIASLLDVRFKENSSYKIVTNLQFPSNFGLGSSSTLINNLAVWSGADAFELNDKSFGGSAYDIAVAKENSAIIFKIDEDKRIFSKIDFKPNFKDELLFVHLNKKQNSREGIAAYRAKEKSSTLIDKLSEITEKVLKETSQENFSELMTQHESLLSEFLKVKTAKELYFDDCPVFVKSLGAWGGDFVMTQKFPGFDDYFREKKFETIFTWEELIR